MESGRGSGSKDKEGEELENKKDSGPVYNYDKDSYIKRQQELEKFQDQINADSVIQKYNKYISYKAAAEYLLKKISDKILAASRDQEQLNKYKPPRSSKSDSSEEEKEKDKKHEQLVQSKSKLSKSDNSDEKKEKDKYGTRLTKIESYLTNLKKHESTLTTELKQLEEANNKANYTIANYKLSLENKLLNPNKRPLSQELQKTGTMVKSITTSPIGVFKAQYSKKQILDERAHKIQAYSKAISNFKKTLISVNKDLKKNKYLNDEIILKLEDMIKNAGKKNPKEDPKTLARKGSWSNRQPAPKIPLLRTGSSRLIKNTNDGQETYKGYKGFLERQRTLTTEQIKIEEKEESEKATKPKL